MNLFLLSVRDPANPRTGLPFIMSCHAFSKVSEQGQVAEVHRHLVFHRNGQHDNITSHNMTCFHVISFHPLPSGCIQVCLSCTRISDKVPGKLGGASTGDTRLLQNKSRHNVARSKIRTSIQIPHKHPEFSIRSRFFQNSPDPCSEFARITEFSSRVIP